MQRITHACALAAFTLLSVAGCIPLQRAADNIRANAPEILDRAVEGAAKVVENPSVGTFLGELGGILSLVVATALGGKVVRDRSRELRSDTLKHDLRERIAKLEVKNGGA